MRYRIIFLIFFTTLLYSQVKNQKEYLCNQSKQESLQSIHSGIPGKQPFWNEYSTMFKYAPSFNFNNSSWIMPEPKYFRYTAFSFTDKNQYTFNVSTPFESLAPIWNNIPNGKVYLKVEAVNNEENNFVLAGEKIFYKAATFCPPYPEAKYSYKEALIKGLNFIYHQPYIKSWIKEKKPNHKLHTLYCYSALEVGSVIDAMLLYYKYNPENDTAIVIAQNAADYLIANSEKKGKPLEYFPQVYEGENLAAGKFKNEMLITQASFTAQSFLSLYEITKKKKYLDTAVRIADTYLKTQLKNGTWFIRINRNSGKPTVDVYSIPIAIVNFLSILSEKYELKKYDLSIKKTVDWIWKNPMQTYDWTGQFEDVEANKPYQNLTKYEASRFAQYIFKNVSKDSTFIQHAKELINFCEDQFVIWENPSMYDNWGNSTATWRTPSVLEQYKCYVPIDASSTQMIKTFLAAYKATSENIFYGKAEALLNSLINSQEANGRIPTFWSDGFNEFWNNCMTSDLYLLDDFVTNYKEDLE